VWVGDGRRDAVIEELQRRKIGVMVNYRAIHRLTFFRETFGFRGGEFPNAEAIGDSTLSLPFYPGMTEDSQREVAQGLKAAL
jgi:UDP-4-amino-4-deoxy-L-arabinose-oxoglutarate aminotransferase